MTKREKPMKANRSTAASRTVGRCDEGFFRGKAFVSCQPCPMLCSTAYCRKACPDFEGVNSETFALTQPTTTTTTTNTTPTTTTATIVKPTTAYPHLLVGCTVLTAMIAIICVVVVLMAFGRRRMTLGSEGGYLSWPVKKMPYHHSCGSAREVPCMTAVTDSKPGTNLSQKLPLHTSTVQVDVHLQQQDKPRIGEFKPVNPSEQAHRITGPISNQDLATPHSLERNIPSEENVEHCHMPDILQATTNPPRISDTPQDLACASPNSENYCNGSVHIHVALHSVYRQQDHQHDDLDVGSHSRETPPSSHQEPEQQPLLNHDSHVREEGPSADNNGAAKSQSSSEQTPTNPRENQPACNDNREHNEHETDIPESPLRDQFPNSQGTDHPDVSFQHPEESTFLVEVEEDCCDSGSYSYDSDLPPVVNLSHHSETEQQCSLLSQSAAPAAAKSGYEYYPSLRASLGERNKSTMQTDDDDDENNDNDDGSDDVKQVINNLFIMYSQTTKIFTAQKACLPEAMTTFLNPYTIIWRNYPG